MFQINNNIMQMFQLFYKQMQNQNPNDLLNKLVSSGKVSKTQVEQAKQMAEQFRSLLH